MQSEYEIIRWVYLFIGLLVCYAEVRQALKLKKTGYSWVKWCLGAMGLYWFSYNLCLILGVHPRYPDLWGDVAGMLTLSFVAAGALLSLRRSR